MSMSFAYQPLVDIRLSLPLGAERLYSGPDAADVEVRDFRPEDAGPLLELLKTEESSLIAEKQALIGQGRQSTGRLDRLLENNYSHQRLLTELEQGEEPSRVQEKKGDATSPKQDSPNFVISIERWQAHRFEYYWNMIRLITLRPGQQDEEIVCDIHHAYLRHQEHGLSVLDDNPSGDDPEYEALSYTWGDLSKRKSIILKGQEIQVTSNLECALRHVRFSDRPRQLWIDAICIDQNNAMEKNVQVLRMPEVFAQASQVLIWLGTESEDSGLALSTIERLGGAEKDMELEDVFLRHAKGVMALRPEPSNLSPVGDLTRKELLSLWALFTERPWWKRVWIIQEICHARKARLVCGHASVNWDSISSMFSVNVSAGKLVERFKPALDSVVFLDHERWKTQCTVAFDELKHVRTSLLSLQGHFYDFEATDPRDQIYALLGVTNCPQEGIEVNYERSIKEVYTEATLCMTLDIRTEDLWARPSLLPLCAAYRGRESQYDLPSWVPDFSIPYRPWLFDISEDRTQLYKASLNMPFIDSLKFDNDGTLTLKGLLHDEIEYVGRAWPEIIENGRFAFRKSDCNTCFREWYQASTRSKLYGSDEERSFAFVRTLMADTYDGERMSAGVLASRHTDFQAWLDLIQPDKDVVVENRAIQRCLEIYSEALPRYIRGWTFCITAKGRFGLVPKTTASGDCVMILYGAPVPVVVREIAGPSSKRDMVIGPSYINGVMDGEVMKSFICREVEEMIVNLV